MLTHPPGKSGTQPATTLNSHEAAEFVGISAKSLERLAARGEPIGRIKIGRRVVYLRSALEQWLISQANGAKGGAQ